MWFDSMWVYLCHISGDGRIQHCNSWLAHTSQVPFSNCSLQHQLREYPVPFGNRLVDLFTELITTAKGWTPLPSPLPPAIESFQQMSVDDHGLGLEYAALDEVYKYLRFGKHLKIPKHWREHVPKEPPMPAKLVIHAVPNSTSSS